eukprot:COSAG02_NODE_65456_length_258_cov_0.635220_1_plen_28_part_10
MRTSRLLLCEAREAAIASASRILGADTR